jgi:hypothetical protein
MRHAGVIAVNELLRGDIIHHRPHPGYGDIRVPAIEARDYAEDISRCVLLNLPSATTRVYCYSRHERRGEMCTTTRGLPLPTVSLRTLSTAVTSHQTLAQIGTAIRQLPPCLP